MKTLRLALVALAVLVATATAQPGGAGKLGVGLMAGEPSGISAKAWLSSNTALDLGLAWDYSWWEHDPDHHDPGLHVHGDFLYHFSNLVPDLEFATLPPYVGIGGRVRFGKSVHVGARVPLGITMLFKEFPIDLFLEVVPMVNLIPSTEPDWNGAIGFRYYFS